MKYAIIENGKVVNLVLADEPIGINWVPGEDAKIGDDFVNEVFCNSAPVIDPANYKNQRANEYPPMSDYIDGIVKGDQAQMQAYIDACLAVKAKYPKP